MPETLDALIARQHEITLILRSMLRSDDSDSRELLLLATELDANDTKINELIEKG